MTRRTSIVSQVGAYFASKGKVMTMEEYKRAEDAPIRFVLIKRTIGSWGRLINMIGDLSNHSAAPAKAVSPSVAEPEAPVMAQEEVAEEVEEAEEAQEEVTPVKTTSEKKK
jgi:hypothetical protein